MTLDKKRVKITTHDAGVIESLVADLFPPASDDQKKKLVGLCKSALTKSYFSPSRTGLVFAGFGNKEDFPSLYSYEIDGIVSGHLRYKQTDSCDIDREGPKARVIPFAQKRMAERFLYGLDEGIETVIKNYCEKSVSKIGEELLDLLHFDDQESASEVKSKLNEAEGKFLKGLKKKTFDFIKDTYGSAIEDMVEFMPKSEIARMAESLIELTSIKHRVSRGVETVGGPVDVAVISRSEGLVWVKRKHYFPTDLNSRYFERQRIKLVLKRKESDDGDKGRKPTSS